jgi:hypothetical protein
MKTNLSKIFTALIVCIGYLLLVSFVQSCKFNGSPKFWGMLPLPPVPPPLAQIIIEPSTQSLTTTEAGGSISYKVSINKKPKDDVLLSISVSDTIEVKLDKPLLTFTTANWDQAQTFTITGQDDLFVDGNKAYTLSLSPSQSLDSEFAKLTIAPYSLQNLDDDVAGIATIYTGGLLTSEAGANFSFTVVLRSVPSSSVTIPTITSTNTSEGTVSPSTLTFTTANWNVPQTVIVTGVDDLLDDGNQSYSIVFGAAVSSDSVYNNYTASSLAFVNADNESFGITVTPTTGLVTNETGGTANFSVVLNNASTSNVTIPISSSNTAEGIPDTSSLVFTPATWNIPQVVTVTGVNDFIQDGSISYTIVIGAATSANSNYNGLDPSDVSVVNTDNDTGGYTIVATNGLTVTDGGQIAAMFTIKLNTQPTSSVTIPISSSNTGEGTVSPSSVTFTPANWSNTQTITISGVSDGGSDGNKSFNIVLSLPSTSDSVYAALDPADQSANSCDNDSGAAIVYVCRTSSNPYTNESGNTAQYFVILATDPGEDVTIPITSSDTSEATVNSPLIINSSNWNQFLVTNRITVTGVNDALYDGDISYNVLLGVASTTSMTGSYHGYNPVDINGLINYDNETYFTVSTISGNTSESGTTATFSIVLPAGSNPAFNVTIGISSNNTGEGTVSPASLIFTSVNFNTPQIVTVTGVDDSVADGNKSFSIITASAVSADTRFNGRNPSDVSVTNTDVGEKRVFISNTASKGNLGGIVGADAICNSDANKPSIAPNVYKALLVLGATRRGSATANTGDSQVDWVFAANTRYFRSNGTTQIFMTNANCIFPFGTLTNSFDSANSDYWTGMNSDWTNNVNTCGSWNSASGASNGTQGNSLATDGTSISFGSANCDNTFNLVCVQQ